MIKVATSLDAPIKLLWPKTLSLARERGCTMLGLGDVVIPGTFIALALRYDLFNHSGASSAPPEMKFPKPYFYASLVAYTLGLIVTTVVMHVFHAAQPALLYLR
jgi:minor histocompatibility antigen H13